MATMLEPKARGLIAYSLFDFANSSFTLIIHAYLFPLYFRNILLAGEQGADTIWGSLFSVSVILAACSAPFLGRLADGTSRYRLFCILGGLSFVSAVFLSFTIGTSL